MNNEWNRLIAMAGVLGLAAIAPSQGLITGLTESKIGSGVAIHITGTHLSGPREIWTSNGHVYILEFNAAMGTKAISLDVNAAGVKGARVGWYKNHPEICHLAFYLNGEAHPKVARVGEGYTVYFDVTPPAPANTVKVTEIPVTKVLAAAQADGLPSVDTSVLKKPLHDMPMAMMTKPAPSAPVVSLNFVNTDVVQILKALAMQSGVNIITAPGVEGKKITVSLEHVSVKDALDFTTALAGLRYAKVQDSYVVADSVTFDSIMTSLADKSTSQNVIRIVPLVSGDGVDIKQALMKWFGPSTLQVIVPGTPTGGATGAAGAGGVAGAGGATAAGGATSPAPAPVPTPGATPGATGAPSATTGGAASPMTASPYILLIGSEEWVSQAESLVHTLDEQILQARTKQTQAQMFVQQQQRQQVQQFTADLMSKQLEGFTQESYQVKNGKAEDLQKALLAQPEFSSLEFLSSPTSSTKQVMVVTGQKPLVDSAIATLSQLDTGASAADTVIYMYEVKYADPRALRESVMANVAGIVAENPPASAADPGIYQSGLATSQTAQTGGASNTTGMGSSQPQSGAAQVAADNGTYTGLQQPFVGDESIAYPMRLLLKGTKQEIEEALTYLKQVDVRPREIALEMRVMELDQTQAEQLGINWSVLTGGTIKAINLNESQAGIGTNTSAANSITGHIGGRNWSSDVTATLDAISDKNNLIARPNILAIDGREAEIFVGDDLKYIQSIQSSQNGTTVTTGDVPVGVRLAVLPRIGGDGDITMDLRPLVSVLKSFTAVPGGGQLPQTSIRISQSTVQIKSGQTIAIGGLIQDSDLLNVQKLPILGDLPIIGQLFRQTTHNKQRTEVVFFLTAREVTPTNQGFEADPRSAEQKTPAELPVPAHRKILP